MRFVKLSLNMSSETATIRWAEGKLDKVVFYLMQLLDFIYINILCKAGQI